MSTAKCSFERGSYPGRVNLTVFPSFSPSHSSIVLTILVPPDALNAIAFCVLAGMIDLCIPLVNIRQSQYGSNGNMV